MLSPPPLFAIVALMVYGRPMIKARALVHVAQGLSEENKVGYLVAMFGKAGVFGRLGATVIASGCRMVARQILELGSGYPFMALSFVLALLASVALFGEWLPPIPSPGAGLVVAGTTVSALTR